jgi:hypothetical protein
MQLEKRYTDFVEFDTGENCGNFVDSSWAEEGGEGRGEGKWTR